MDLPELTVRTGEPCIILPVKIARMMLTGQYETPETMDDLNLHVTAIAALLSSTPIDRDRPIEDLLRRYVEVCVGLLYDMGVK